MLPFLCFATKLFRMQFTLLNHYRTVSVLFFCRKKYWSFKIRERNFLVIVFALWFIQIFSFQYIHFKSYSRDKVWSVLFKTWSGLFQGLFGGRYRFRYQNTSLKLPVFTGLLTSVCLFRARKVFLIKAERTTQPREEERETLAAEQ